MKHNNPAKIAAELIDNYCIPSPDKLDIEEIVWAEKLVIKEIPLRNYMGMINFNSNYGLITINSNSMEATQKKFTLAHEMGHFFNERNKPDHLKGCRTEDLSNFKSHKHNEENANIFAAELLMHRPWFNDFTKDRDINFNLLKEIAEYFNVSLSAAAFRYINIGRHPAAIIFSRKGIVEWSAFHDFFPLKFLTRGYKVPKDSSAYDFFNGKTMQTEPDLITAKSWFAEDFNCRPTTYLYEQNVAMPNYNAVLTLLWLSEFD